MWLVLNCLGGDFALDDSWNPRAEPERGSREQASRRGRESPVETRRRAGGAASTWQLSLAIWPVENRPALMQNEAVVNEMELDTLLAYMKSHERHVEREGKGQEEFGRDRRLPTKMFKQQQDNCMDLLHEMR
jgi:hypothetical protein